MRGLLLLASCAACASPPVPAPRPENGPAVELTDAERAAIARLSPLPPPSADPTNRWSQDPAARSFGERLFIDPRLSADGTISCASCHDPARDWCDGLHVGLGREPLARNTPSLWNVAYQRWFFWDGRADSLWAQALVPLEHPAEHGGDRLQYAHLIAGDEELRAQYEGVFGALPPLEDGSRFPRRGRPGADDPAIVQAWSSMAEPDRDAVDRVFANLGKALGAFTGSLIARETPFDRFAAALAGGDPAGFAALDASAQRGLKLFVGRAGCRSCHSGPTFSDLEFHDIRVPPREGGPRTDSGRWLGIERVRSDPFNGLGRYSDDREGRGRERLAFLARGEDAWGAFKTPTLRNVARTAPYMDQGQLATLRDVVEYYSTLRGAVSSAHHSESILRPLELDEREIDDLVAFLESLTSEG